MMSKAICAGMLLFLVGARCTPAESAVRPLSASQVHDWLLHVIPLPKQVTLDGAQTIPVAAVAVQVEGDADQPHVLAAKALAADLIQRAKVQHPPLPARAGFVIVVGVLDHGDHVAGIPAPAAGEKLRNLKNADQAYLIESTADRMLLVTGIDTKGVFYGVETLRRLVLSTLKGAGATMTVDLPHGRILDWPDLAERGEWGGSANRDLEWLARLKMNLVESHCRSLRVTDAGKGVADFDKSLLHRGAKCAVKVVPIITHLDQLQRTGLFRVFPQTLGKGDPSKWPGSVKPACFSRPETVRVLADWMVSLARDPEITDLNVWLSENHVSCQCEQCRKKGQFVLEARAVAEGYALAKKVHPKLGLRVLLTQGSHPDNDRVIATLPRDIGITYYDGGRTYDSSREPMIYPLLERYVKDGGWLGCYPQLTASWRIVCPWSAPQFIHFRMNEFVTDGLQCLCGYATPDNRFYDFNVNAAAEWSWNAAGRDEREFALAYFTCKGVGDPQTAADWAVLLGPVGWDVYGSRVPYNWFFGAAARAVRTGKVPGLGGGPYRYFPTEKHLTDDLTVCARAAKLARNVGDAALVAETQVIEGYVKMLALLRRIGRTAGGKKKLTAEEKDTAAKLMAQLDAATNQTTRGLSAWRAAVAPAARASRYDDTVHVTEQTCADVGEYLGRFGIADPGRPYRKKTAGHWKTEDFSRSREVEKRWEVTDLLDGPGVYRVQFVYRSGWYGLGISRVSLVDAPSAAPDQATPVAVDDHPGTAAYKNKANVYTLTVKNIDPRGRYFLVARIRGCPRQTTPDRQGCNGEVFFWKQRPQ